MELGQELQTVLVTGATGFVSCAVARRLRSENCTARTLVRRTSDAAALTTARCELRYGDITGTSSLREAAEDADAVVHCAWMQPWILHWAAKATVQLRWLGSPPRWSVSSRQSTWAPD